MKIKRKINKGKIKTFIKNSGILHTSKCTVNQIKTEIQYTFFNVEFWLFSYLFVAWIVYICSKKNCL